MVEVTPDEVTTENVKDKRPSFHKQLLIVTIAWFAGLAILAAIVYSASPGPETQALLGVSIGSWEGESGIAFLSGRRLHCQPLNDESTFSTTCQVEIAGKTLEIRVSRWEPPNTMQLSGRCAAFYDGQEWSCRIGSRHAHVHWFAIIDPPLGLSNAQMDDLRQQFPLENAPEEPFIIGMLIVAVITTVLVIVNFIVWLKPKIKRSWLLLIPAVPIGLITFYGTLYIGVFVTSGFWD